MGVTFTSLRTAEYLTDFKTAKFFVKNIILLRGIETSLPGVFLDVPFKGVVNGSLWTLPWEVTLYAVIALCLSTCNFIKRRYPAMLELRHYMLLASILLFITDSYLKYYSTTKGDVHLFLMFFSGATYYCWRESIRLTSRWFILLLSIVALSLFFGKFFNFAYLITAPYLTLYLAYMPNGIVRRFNEFGDYSYGIYIYAFPVQQSIAAIFLGCSVLFMFTTSLLMTLFLAILSWHLVEKRCLRLKDPIILFTSLFDRIGLSRFFKTQGV